MLFQNQIQGRLINSRGGGRIEAEEQDISSKNRNESRGQGNDSETKQQHHSKLIEPKRNQHKRTQQLIQQQAKAGKTQNSKQSNQSFRQGKGILTEPKGE